MISSEKEPNFKGVLYRDGQENRHFLGIFFYVKTVAYDLIFFTTKNGLHKKKYRYNIYIFKHIIDGVEKGTSQISLLLTLVINLD